MASIGRRAQENSSNGSPTLDSRIRFAIADLSAKMNTTNTDIRPLSFCLAEISVYKQLKMRNLKPTKQGERETGNGEIRCLNI